MKSDNLQEIFYILTKEIGLSDKSAQHLIQEYSKMFLEWYEEAEEGATAYKQYLLENKLENFIVRSNEENEEDIDF